MELKELLFSLLPLILIVIFSWLFSSRSSKREEQDELEETFIYSDAEEDEFEESTEENDLYQPVTSFLQHNAGSEKLDHHKELMSGYDSSRHSTNPEPIKPKWWGA